MSILIGKEKELIVVTEFHHSCLRLMTRMLVRLVKEDVVSVEVRVLVISYLADVLMQQTGLGHSITTCPKRADAERRTVAAHRGEREDARGDF